jgi:hypothetical protein
MKAAKKKYCGKVELEKIIADILRRLKEGTTFSQITESSPINRTNVSRQIHKVLPFLARHVYSTYTRPVSYPKPSAQTNTNEMAINEDNHDEVSMELLNADAPIIINAEKLSSVIVPPICKLYMNGQDYFLDDSTYIYVKDVPHNFDSNRMLFDQHKTAITIRFYNITQPTGEHICYFGPNDSQSEDYITMQFYKESEYFRSLVDSTKTKISDRGFNRIIGAREWSMEVGLTIHTAADASDVPWRVDVREENQLYSAMRAPAEQRHAPIRQFHLLNEFPFEEIKYVEFWYQLAVGLSNKKVDKSFVSLKEVDEEEIKRTLKGQSIVWIPSFSFGYSISDYFATPSIFRWMWPASYLSPEAVPASLEDLSKGIMPIITTSVPLLTIVQQVMKRGAASFTKDELMTLSCESLKEILRQTNLGVSGRKEELANRIYFGLITPPRPKLHRPDWFAPRIPPPAFDIRCLCVNYPSTSFSPMTQQAAYLFPRFTESDLIYLLRTPTTSRELPMYSKSLIRSEDHGNDFKVDLHYLSFENKAIVRNTVHSSMKGTTQTIFLFYTFPFASPVILEYWNSNNLTRWCYCKNGFSGNCSHIASTLRHIAILQGTLQPHRKAYAAVVEDTINIRK